MSGTSDQTRTSFEPGGRVEGMLPLCVPQLGGREWDYLKQCLDSTFVSSVGPFVDRFERELAATVGSRFAVATASGTAALHIALLVSGVEPDDEVLMPAITFVAPANAIRYAGAWPVFIDVEPEFWQLDAAKVAAFLETECVPRNGRLENKTTGRRVKAILPVHVLGHPCDLDPLMALAARYGLVVVEDATESLGARYRDRSPGSFGLTGCFSFNGNKIITSGGGGMIVTDDPVVARRAKYLTTQAKDDPVEYIHEEIGYNYRLTNVQAALGCAQLELLPGFVAAKRRIAAIYRERFDALRGVTFMREAPWAQSSFWLSTIVVDEAEFGMDSRALMRRLHTEGIQARPLWHPLHRLRPFHGAQAFQVEHADRLCRDCLSLPSSTGLSDDDARRVAATVVNAGRGAS
jgi:perosamine synthetase